MSYNFLCEKVGLIKFLVSLNLTKYALTCVNNLCRLIMCLFILLAQGNISEKMFGTLSLELQLTSTKKRSLENMTDLMSLNASDAELYLKALQALERESIPWQRYWDRAIAIVLPMIIMLFLFTDMDDLSGAYWLGSFIMPIFFTLLKSTIRQLHHLAGSLKPTQYYVNAVESWLQTALLLSPATPVFNNVISLTKIEISHDWEQIQFEIVPKDTQSGSILKIMLLIIKMLEHFKIDYIVVRKKHKTVAAIYVRAADAYASLASSIGGMGSSVQQFNTLLAMNYEKLQCRTSIEKNVLNPFRRNKTIMAYWWNETHDRTLECDIKFFEEISLDATFMSKNNIMVNQGIYTFKMLIGAHVFPQLEKILVEIKEMISQPIMMSSSAPKATSAYSFSIRKRVEPQAVAGPRGGASVAEKPKVIDPTWSIGRHTHRASDENVHMIRGTEYYKNPIYVVGTIIFPHFRRH